MVTKQIRDPGRSSKAHFPNALQEMETRLNKRMLLLHKRVKSIAKDRQDDQKLLATAIIQEQILTSKVIKVLLGTLILLIVFGIMVWLGGVIYGGIQIDSLKSRAAELQVQIGNSREQIEKMEKNYQDEVNQQKQETIRSILRAETDTNESKTLAMEVIQTAEAQVSQAATAVKTNIQNVEMPVIEAGKSAEKDIQKAMANVQKAKRAADTQIASSQTDVTEASKKAITTIQAQEKSALLTIKMEREKKAQEIMDSQDPLGYYRIEVGVTWFYAILGLLLFTFAFSVFALVISLRIRRRP